MIVSCVQTWVLSSLSEPLTLSLETHWGVSLTKEREAQDLDCASCNGDNVKAPSPGCILNQETTRNRPCNDPDKRSKCINRYSLSSLMRPKQVGVDATSDLRFIRH